MNKMVVFCVETNKTSDTDTVYIKETIRRFYKVNTKTAFRYVYMGTKAKAKSNSVAKDIKSKIQGNEKNACIIFCIDADGYANKPEDKALYEDIKIYCIDKGYQFVFFCRDVEDVYWGHQVTDKDKVKMAVKFRKQNCIDTLQESALMAATPRLHAGNLLNVLDRLLERK